MIEEVEHETRSKRNDGWKESFFAAAYKFYITLKDCNFEYDFVSLPILHQFVYS